MISKKEVQHVAKLARLGITKNEEEKFGRELSSILRYIEKLKKVDVSGVEPTSHPFKVENVMRSDEVGQPPQKLLAGFLKVKSIFN